MGGIAGMGGISENGLGDAAPAEKEPILGLNFMLMLPDIGLPKLLRLCMDPECLLAAKPWLRPGQLGLGGKGPTWPFEPVGLWCCHQGLGWHACMASCGPPFCMCICCFPGGQSASSRCCSAAGPGGMGLWGIGGVPAMKGGVEAPSLDLMSGLLDICGVAGSGCWAAALGGLLLRGMGGMGLRLPEVRRCASA